MLTLPSVMLEYSWELMGQNKNFSSNRKKLCIAVELLHFFPKYVRQSSHQ